MRCNNWLSPLTRLASRTNWVRRARRFLNRKARLGTAGYVTPGQISNRGPSRWYSSRRMRRALQRQDYYATINQFERLEDRTLLTVTIEAVATASGEGSNSLSVSSFTVPAGNDLAVAVLTTAFISSSGVNSFGGQGFSPVATANGSRIYIATLGDRATSTTGSITGN